jgi:hypothetical protein
MIYTGAIFEPLKPNEDYVLPKATTPFDWDNGYLNNFAITFKVKNQYQSYSCGGQAVAYYCQAILDTEDEQSARFPYSFAYAEPNGGTAYYSLGAHACKRGTCDEKLAVSYRPDGTTDEPFMRTKNFTPEAITDGLTKLGYKYAKTDTNSIDDIANAIKENKGVVLGIYGQNNGTWLTENPRPPISTKDRWCHWVWAYGAVMKNGKKAILFINSWGDKIGDKGHQYITEEYFDSPYGIFMAWSITAKEVIVPRYIFEKPIAFGETSKDVTYLQKRLAEEGYNQPVTGHYAKITAQNVLAYQRKYKVGSEGELTYLAGRRVGKKTLGMLNS